MKELALKTPSKDAKKLEKLEFNLLDDSSFEESPDAVDSSAETETDSEDPELDELRKLFVGEVDVTEGSRRHLSSRRVSDRTPCLAQEPLLIETKRRFVLFPIQYPEVHTTSPVSRSPLTRPYRFGRCTRKPKLPSGRQKRWTSQRISMTGTTA